MPPERVALLFRDDRAARTSGELTKPRLVPVADALRDVGLAPEPAVYAEEFAEEVRDQLTGVAAALVWVDPIANGRDRAELDAMLRDVAAARVWVSAHPDVILKMGTKEVLYRTRELGWGSDVRLYQSVDELREQLPAALRDGPRVLKQSRGNGGIGVWKIELAAEPDRVLVQNAERRDEIVEELSLADALSRFDGRIIDQPFAPRITEGLVRCYVVENQVVGFCRQYAAEGATRVFGLPSAKTMFPADEPMFASLRARMEGEWVPGLQRLVDVDDASLPVLWDADFLFGDDDDSYVLGEINVSSVSPFPQQAVAKLAAAVARRLKTARR